MLDGAQPAEHILERSSLNNSGSPPLSTTSALPCVRDVMMRVKFRMQMLFARAADHAAARAIAAIRRAAIRHQKQHTVR